MAHPIPPIRAMLRLLAMEDVDTVDIMVDMDMVDLRYYSCFASKDG